MSPHTPHLEVICPDQSRNRKHILPGQNPAKTRLRVCLDDLLNSIFCETLGMKINLNVYQIMALKLREGTSTTKYYPAKEGGRLPLTRIKPQEAATSSFGFATCPLADLVSNLVVLRCFVT